MCVRVLCKINECEVSCGRRSKCPVSHIFFLTAKVLTVADVGIRFAERPGLYCLDFFFEVVRSWRLGPGSFRLFPLLRLRQSKKKKIRKFQGFCASVRFQFSSSQSPAVAARVSAESPARIPIQPTMQQKLTRTDFSAH